MPSRVRIRLPRLGLLGRFSLLSLLAIALLGFVLGKALEEQITERALRSAEQSGQLVSGFGIQSQLSPVTLYDGLSPEAVSSLDQLLHAGYSSDEVAGITIWNRDGVAVYSDDHRMIGQVHNGLRGFGPARDGHTASFVTDEQPRTIDVYVPLRFSEGPPEGIFEIKLHHQPVADAIREQVRRLYLLLGLGLLILWAALFRIVAGASKRLRVQAAENEYQARHDLLTGLPNRRNFYDSVRAGLAEAGASTTAVMLMDLDRFKEVNDTLGHHSGDLLLQQAALRLQRAVRAGDTIARLGGDEFAVLLPDVSEETAVDVAGRVRDALHERFVLDGLTVDVEASVGIALHPEHADDVETLIQRADVAMYVAKEAAGGHAVYSAEDDQFSPGRLSMVGELRHAIEDGGLVLHYQPKAALETGEVSHVEALVRWEHPERGLIPPMEFIPLAEHTGLIKQLSAFVLDEALRQCAEWRDGGIDLSVAVNLSVRNLLDDDLPQQIAGLLRKHDVPATRLLVELTESTIMADPARALDVLSGLNEMGVGLAIDDFGTGYSSLTYLKRLPVDELKIDRTFVGNMAADEEDAFIVRSTIDLGRNLGLQVVAEGVEDEASWNQLTELGCDFAQGYYLSRPVPATELARWLRSEADSREAQRDRDATA